MAALAIVSESLALVSGLPMLLLTAFTYAFLALFVITSTSRNRRESRPDSPALTMVGWGLMSTSFAAAGLLLAFAAGLIAAN